jgi:hypothetical protein
MARFYKEDIISLVAFRMKDSQAPRRHRASVVRLNYSVSAFSPPCCEYLRIQTDSSTILGLDDLGSGWSLCDSAQISSVTLGRDLGGITSMWLSEM